MKQFISDHFAVLVVLTVFCLLFTAYMMILFLHVQGPSIVDWLEGEMKEVIGAILMGLTGTGARALLGKTDTVTTTVATSETKP
jgi:hypothetical protein